jgi:hypothetical protein
MHASRHELPIPEREQRRIINAVVNDSDAEDLKLYTLYSPPEHLDKTIHPTKAAAGSHEEHFDGKTTE